MQRQARFGVIVLRVDDVTGALARRLDRLIGAGGLGASTRLQLQADQIRAVTDLSPTLSLGQAIVALLLVHMARGTPLFPWIAAWGLLFGASVLFASRAWLLQLPRRTTLQALASGIVWGVLPVIVFAFDDSSIQFAVGAGVAGVLCSTILATAAMPAAALAFTAPVMVGCLVSIIVLGTTIEANAIAVLMLSFAATVPLVALSLARQFVRHVASEARIQHQNEIISLLLKEFEENSSDWLWDFNPNGHMERVSERFATAVGQPAETLIGTHFVTFLGAGSRSNVTTIQDIDHAIAERATFHDHVIRFERDNGECWWRISGKPLFDEAGDFTGYVGTASDITAERLAERQISFLAHNDALTGMPNRSKFTDHLCQSVARLERYGTPFAVLYLDLDQFKAVNDSLGHMIGDKLLVQASRRIRSCIRDADVAARLGGDEFAVILNAQFETDLISDVAARLIECVSKPYHFEEGVVNIGLSIGIALAPVNGSRPDQILRNSDLALYRAKGAGKGAFRFFESQMDSDVRERRMLELELREAVRDGQLMLYYQPLVDADGKKPSGFEALIRWDHPVRGIIPPAEFIPIAEQTGLIKQIGDWTLFEACEAAARWPEDVFVAVNLSARHFQLSNIADVVRAALQASGLDPRRLELEITESLLMEQADEVIERLTELKALGVTVAMDDFGTGYSSLSYLLKFPFDKIKIDKSFVKASTEDIVARDILRSIAALGKTLNMRITAEGVETLEQVDFLSDIACHQLQGFYFAQPLDEADLASYFLNQFERKLLDGRLEAVERGVLPHPFLHQVQ